MSCTVVALPIALAHIIGAAIAAGTAIAATDSKHPYEEENNRELNKFIQDMQNREYQSQNISDIIEKEYTTVYMDKDILLKTLEEHGVTNINSEDENKITGLVESFSLSFERSSNNEPYVLKITCNKCDDSDEKLNDLNSEYALNVQEEAYLNLIENLKENNMQIEEEVVEDDNTIVLTINLE